MDWAKIEDNLAGELRDFLGGHPAVFGLSGGIDSAVVAALAVKAVGIDRVICPFLPSGSWHMEKGGPADRAREVARHLCIRWFDPQNIVAASSHIGGLAKIVVGDIPGLCKRAWDVDRMRLVYGNSDARVRMAVVYAISNIVDGIVVGTGNLTEILLGYTTKHGDSACDVLPLGMMLKTQVWELARHQGLPKSVVDAVPSADLWAGQSDEGEIGATYQQLDKAIVELFGESCSPESQPWGIESMTTVQQLVLDRWMTLRHKRSLPPVLKAWGKTVE
jgi:NAD+ synthase